MGLTGAIIMGANAFTGAVTQGQAAQAQGDYQNQMSIVNSQFSEMSARDAIARGAQASKQRGIETKQMIGSQRAGYAAQGIDVNSGTARDIQDQTAEMGVNDQMTIKNNAWREALGYKVQAISQRAQGQMAKDAGDFEARSSIITGGMRAASAGLDYYSRFGGSTKTTSQQIGTKSIGGGRYMTNRGE